MISFRVVLTRYFITRNEISFLSKWPHWNNTHNEFHFGLYHVFFWIELNNFILRWYCTIAEANKNQPLITIIMVNIYHVEADTKVLLIR